MAKKVLMLHGFGQSSSIFGAKTSQLRRQLEPKGYEFIYPDGPIELKTDDDGVDVTSSIKSYAWWITETLNDKKSFDVAPSIKKIKSIVKEEGPFVGVVGFSQGAALAELVVNNMKPWGNEDDLQFAIFASGFIWEDRMVNDEGYLSKKIEIPTLMIIGLYDTIISNDRSYEFAKKNTKPGSNIVIEHSGAHYFPSNPKTVEQITEWVSKVTKP